MTEHRLAVCVLCRLRGIYVSSGLVLMYFAGEMVLATWRDAFEWLSLERKAVA